MSVVHWLNSPVLMVKPTFVNMLNHERFTMFHQFSRWFTIISPMFHQLSPALTMFHQFSPSFHQCSPRFNVMSMVFTTISPLFTITSPSVRLFSPGFTVILPTSTTLSLPGRGVGGRHRAQGAVGAIPQRRWMGIYHVNWG